LLRKIFFFWRKEQSVSVIPKESEPELPVKKVEEVKVYHLEKTILTESKKQEQKKSSQQLLLEYPKEKISTYPIIKIAKEDKIVKNILGINFTFDNETLKIYEEDFANESGWEISYDNYGCYLARINKHGYLEHFHRWLKMDEVEKFAKDHNLKLRDVIVHHKNHEHTDNRLRNLDVVSRKDHDEHHKKEKAYKNWNGTRVEFEDWWFRHYKLNK
ncbi:MAG: hypothetical protein AABX66_03260, partial [Nanoarchaeota archaeon]